MQDPDIREIHPKNSKKYFATHINIDPIQALPKFSDIILESNFQSQLSTLNVPASAHTREFAQIHVAEKQIYSRPLAKKRKNIFRALAQKQAALLLFTIFVLGFGIFLGARFVSFANSISTTRQSFYKTVSVGLGAAFGPLIPGIGALDDSKVAETIRDKGQLNILLLGYGGSGHGGSYLTDTIILLNVDFGSGSVKFLPLPRDLWVKIPTRGYDGAYAKINAAYAFGIDQLNYPNKLPQFTGENGGGNLAIYEVAQITGVKADYFAAVDFYGFKQIVDALRGVEVNVERAFTDYTYPSGDENVNAASCVAEDIPDSIISNCRYKKVHFEAGPQLLNGSRALEYARSRHAAGEEGSDFARSKRQQKLLAAIEQKILTAAALPKIFAIMDGIQEHFKTNLSLAEMQDLFKYVSQSNSENFVNLSLTDSGNNLLISSRSEDGQWILLPARGLGNWNDLRSFVSAAFDSQNTASATQGKQNNQ